MQHRPRPGRPTLSLPRRSGGLTGPKGPETAQAVNSPGTRSACQEADDGPVASGLTRRDRVRGTSEGSRSGRNPGRRWTTSHRSRPRSPRDRRRARHRIASSETPSSMASATDRIDVRSTPGMTPLPPNTGRSAIGTSIRVGRNATWMASSMTRPMVRSDRSASCFTRYPAAPGRPRNHRTHPQRPPPRPCRWRRQTRARRSSPARSGPAPSRRPRPPLTCASRRARCRRTSAPTPRPRWRHRCRYPRSSCRRPAETNATA